MDTPNRTGANPSANEAKGSARSNPTSTVSLGTARLVFPRLSLSNCVRGIVIRNTLGFSLNERARYNCFPATPNCNITWFFTGGVEMVEFGSYDIRDGAHWPLRETVIFTGPQNRPTVSQALGPTHAMMLMLTPEAFEALTGIEPGTYLNRTLAARDVLPDQWMELCQAVLVAPDDTARISLIEHCLDDWWQIKRPDNPTGSKLMEDWTHGLALRAATSGLGRGLRQIERRIKRWTGQPLRELRGISRAERAFFASIMADERGELNWAGVAQAAGYADQSHLSRQTRRYTGYAPDALRRLIAEDESFWPYRIWGFDETGMPR